MEEIHSNYDHKQNYNSTLLCTKYNQEFALLYLYILCNVTTYCA